MKNLLKEVLQDIKPSQAEEKNLKSKIDEVIKKINAGLDAKAILGGSGAKGTWLKTFDADIFVKFNKKYENRNISDMLGKHLKKKFRVQRLHGSRDYFRLKKGKLTFEIVPILDIKKPEHAANITDMSPFHSKFVNKFKVQDDIRLMKQFCKASRCYGAESYLMGFSGYVCELLVIHYKGFAKLIKAAAKWHPKVIIDPAKKFGRKNILYEINESKRVGPMIIVDPVQKERNAAAALSQEKFDRFVQSAKAFVKRPHKKFFDIPVYSTKELMKKNIVLEINPLRGKQDVVGAKLLKVFKFLHQELEKNDFQIQEADWEWNSKVIMWFRTKESLPKYTEIKGPPLKMKQHVRTFKKKYKNAKPRGRRMYARVKRKYTVARALLHAKAKHKYIKERVAKIIVR